MNSYLRQIDSLRFYAVTGVMLMHLYPDSLPSLSFLKHFYEYVPGVPLFFCISGFLITGILIKNQGEQGTGNLLKNFYARRFLRIFPLYYLTLILLVIANPMNYREWFVSDLFYFTNINQAFEGSFGNSPAPHFWSLAVEEQFYLLWPFIILLGKNKIWRIGLALSIFLLGFFSKIIFPDSFAYSITIGCWSYLGMGALLSVLMFYHKQLIQDQKKWMDLLLIVFLFWLILEIFLNLTADKMQIYLVGIIIIPLLVLRFSIGYKHKILKLIFENRAVIYLGKISYGIYIFHLLAIFPASMFIHLTGWEWLEQPVLNFFLKVFLTILIASLSWELFEKKINNLKKHFEY